MDISNKKEPIILFIGDTFFFYLSLWLMIMFRYDPFLRTDAIHDHLFPFSILFLIWVLVFFIAGLYEKHTLLFKSRLPGTILNTVISNSIIAIAFFYFIPSLGITPKTNLFLYLVICFSLITLWRIYIIPFLGFRKKEKAILIGSGVEMKELYEEVNNNERYSLKFISSIDLNQVDGIDFKNEILDKVYSENVSSIVIDLKNEKVEPILPKLYNLIFSDVRFVDFYKVYEDIFDRIPLSLVGYNWFLENISFSSRFLYDILKRIMDITIALVLAVTSLVVYPFVAILIKLEDWGPVFIKQERIGKGNKIIHLYKFRSMRASDSGVWLTEGDDRITKVGYFLRKSRIDELPQLWNVIKGDMSLIGPRPDIIDLGKKLSKEIPYYTVRNLIKPGLSGWAQITQELPPQSLEETKMRLSYDLYYIKNHSFMLDLKIALKTVRILLSRTGK